MLPNWLWSFIQMTALEPAGLNAFQATIALFTAVNSLGIFIVIFKAGGYTRQIEINTQELQTIKEHGSPAVQTLGSKIDDLSKRVDILTDTVMRGTCKYAGKD